MKFKKLEIRNYKSFGNNLQSISFDTENGNLIGLLAKNGGGKSSIRECIEFALFNRIFARDGKRIAIDKTINRINGNNMFVGLNFINNDGDDIYIKKNVAPNKSTIELNGEDFSKQFKLLPDYKKLDIIGFNYDVYKSFISISINDFKDFMSLSTDEKKGLLDKLFNLGELDGYTSITKELKKSSEKDIETYNRLLKETLELKNKILKPKNNIKEEIRIRKIEYKNLTSILSGNTNLLTEYQTDIDVIRNNINLFNTTANECENSLKNINEKIRAFEAGVCPICNTTLLDENDYYILLKNDRDDKFTLMNESRTNVRMLNSRLSPIYDKKNILENETISIKDKMSKLSTEAKILSNMIDEDVSNISLEELEYNKNLYQNKIKELEDLIKSYDELIKILSWDGIRKEIIKSIVVPVNDNLEKIIKDMNSPYTIKLNDSFDAKVYERGNVVESGLLSSGESKRLNIAIALAYISMIIKMRETNLLFLDEVFVSVDLESIDILLDILRKFAKDNKINIIIVHHADIESTKFDKVIRLKKNIFTEIVL